LRSPGHQQGEARIEHARKEEAKTQFEANSGYEHLDVPSWLPFWLGCILAAFVILVLAFITISYPLATHQQYRGPLKALPPAPRLQSAPERDLERYLAAKREELRGSSRTLPIEVAMQKVAKQGWRPST
jgi:hypothetical protein